MGDGGAWEKVGHGRGWDMGEGGAWERVGHGRGLALFSGTEEGGERAPDCVSLSEPHTSVVYGNTCID